MTKFNPDRLELLAPGGSFTSVKAAFAAGADAVYMGGSRFSARAYAESVSEEHSLEDAIDYAHLHGKSLYVTVNTLLKEEEICKELYDYVRPLYEQGVDAILVQDPGVMNFLHREFPDLPLHASTQMTLMNPDGTSLLKDYGVNRVVAPRELNLKELAALCAKSGMELEAFIHGAICYCYSGQCLYSGVIGGRSGNRGRCAQPCRLPYAAFDEDGKRMNAKTDPCLLSLKDMNTLRFLPDLIEAGVMSFKIEGRMKSPVYTAGVVSVYRKYLDLYLEKGREGFVVDPQDEYALTQYFDRGGTTDYLRRHNGREMMATKEKPRLRLPDQKLLEATDKKYVGVDLKEDVTAYINIPTGDYATVTYMHERGSGFAMSENLVTPALKTPLDQAAVRKQFGKTGASAYQVKAFETELSADAFMPVQEMNRMRRSALENLEESILASYRRSLPAAKAPQRLDDTVQKSAPKNSASETLVSQKPAIILEAATVEQFDLLLGCKAADTIYLDSAMIRMSDLAAFVKKAHAADKKLFLVLARIMREPAVKEFEKYHEEIFACGLDGIVAASMDGLGILARYHCPLDIVIDHSFYSWNRESLEFMQDYCKKHKLKLIRTCAPLELHESELKSRGMLSSELMIYGAIPMMISAGCVRKTCGNCDHKNAKTCLSDRKNVSFVDQSCCKYCYNIIYNSVPVYLLDREEELKKLGAEAYRLSFTVEEEKEIRKILKDVEAFAENKKTLKAPEAMTRGHFLRGVL